MSDALTAANLGLLACHVCKKLSRAPSVEHAHLSCPRCHSALHRRKPNALARSAAFLIAGMILYIPANTLPVMTVTTLGKSVPDTILSGVQTLIVAGMWPLALVVFVASFVVPIAKMVVMTYLIASVRFRMRSGRRDRSRLYRITEAVGRWSMIDIYVVTILVAVVKLGAIANIEPGLGIMSFGAVVILTILSAEAFDPRSIWDAEEGQT